MNPSDQITATLHVSYDLLDANLWIKSISCEITVPYELMQSCSISMDMPIRKHEYEHRLSIRKEHGKRYVNVTLLSPIKIEEIV